MKFKTFIAIGIFASGVPAFAQDAPAAATPTESAPAASHETSGGLTVHLICNGIGDHKVVNTSFGTIFGRHHSATVIGGSTSQDQFDEQMDVDINGDLARVRVPRRFLPPLHGGGDGWFSVKDLQITEEAVTGMVLINFANHPRLRIDRRSGSIALDGKVGSYAGKCEPYDASKRAF